MTVMADYLPYLMWSVIAAGPVIGLIYTARLCVVLRGIQTDAAFRLNTDAE